MAGTEPQAKRRKDNGEDEALTSDQVKSALTEQGPHHTEDLLLECIGGQYVAADKNILYRATGTELLRVLVMGTELNDGGGSDSTDQVARRIVALGGKRYPVVPLLGDSAEGWKLVMHVLYQPLEFECKKEDMAVVLHLAEKYALQNVMGYCGKALEALIKKEPSQMLFAIILAKRYNLNCSESMWNSMTGPMSKAGVYDHVNYMYGVALGHTPPDFHAVTTLDMEYLQRLQSFVTAAKSIMKEVDNAVLFDLLGLTLDTFHRSLACGLQCDECKRYSCPMAITLYPQDTTFICDKCAPVRR